MFRTMTSTLLILASALSLNSQACPQQNENFFLREYNGQEKLNVGHIDTLISQVAPAHRDFYIAEVSLNGRVLCAKGSNFDCPAIVPLRKGPLTQFDHVRVTFRNAFVAGQEYEFERSSPVADIGSLCRPIFEKKGL